MFEKSLSRQLQDLVDLSPWGNQQKNTISTQTRQMPRKRKMKYIIPKAKPVSQRKSMQKKHSIKMVEHVLPPVNKRSQTLQQYKSLTIQQPSGKLIRNISSHRLDSPQSMTKLMPDRQYLKMRLSGRKYEIVPQQRNLKNFTQQCRPSQNYLTNNTVLLISKKKEDILKRVLNQIQGRIKQIGSL